MSHYERQIELAQQLREANDTLSPQVLKTHGGGTIDEMEYPSEFQDVYKVLEYGATKYEPNNWLKPDGKRSTYTEYHDSAFHHLARSFAGVRADEETKLDHLLHAAINCLMLYTRMKRGIKHPNDK